MPALYLGDHPRLTFPLGPFCFPPNAPVLSAQFFPDVGPEIVLVNEEWESVFTLTEPWDFEQTYSSTSYTEEWDRSTLARFDSFIVSVVDTSFTFKQSSHMDSFILSLTDTSSIIITGAGDTWFYSQTLADSSSLPVFSYGFAIQPETSAEAEYFAISATGGNNLANDVGNEAQVFALYSETLPWLEIFGGGTYAEMGTIINVPPGDGYFVARRISGSNDVEIALATGTFFTTKVTFISHGLYISSAVFGFGISYFGSRPFSDSDQLRIGVNLISDSSGPITPRIQQRSSGGIWTEVYVFDSTRSEVSCMSTFSGTGNLYAGVSGLVGFGGGYAEIWSTPDGTTWTMIHSFTGSTFITDILEFQGKFYALVHSATQGSPDDGNLYVYSTTAADDTVWTVEFIFPEPTYEGYKTTKFASFSDSSDTILFAGVGADYLTTADGEIITALAPRIYRSTDGSSWSLSVDFGVDFADTNPTVCALATDPVTGKVYAATGDFARYFARAMQSGIVIYTFPTADL